MRYLSVCSGIEAATVAWHDLGWKPAAFSEIEPFPSAVLKHHYPDVPNVGDMTKFKEWDIGTIDLLVGGTPCQSFSVAGLRKGLDDPRGNLMLTYLAIADKYRPRWLVWENVPGVLSSNGGKDFGTFLGALGEIGYGFAYRVLDAQYFGVAQRRRRVFVVGCLGDWRAAAAVLFERESLSGNPAPSREKGQATPTNFVPSVASCLETTCHDYSRADGFNMIAAPIALAENTIGRQPMNGGNGDGFTVAGPMYTLNATGVHGVAQPIPLDLRNAGRNPEKHDAVNRQGVGVGEAGDPSHTITSAFVHGVAQPMVFNIAPGKGALKDDIHITEAITTKTLDASGSNPAMHQGGAAIIQQMAQPVYELHGQDSRVKELKDVCGTVSATYGMGGGNVPVTIQPMVLMDQGGGVMNVMQDGTVGTLRRETHGHEPVVMAPTLTASNNPSRSPQSTEVTNQVAAVHAASMAVRRLTPVECERLQGFPDNYTNIPWRKQPESPDGPRYKALGNSMAVPVMAWIGRRIANAP